MKRNLEECFSGFLFPFLVIISLIMIEIVYKCKIHYKKYL